MNSRNLSFALLALNLGLAGTFIYLIATFKGPGPLPATSPARLVTNTITQVAVRKVGTSTNFLAALGNRPLSWGALESTNYTVYIQNLLAFGCPEETVRDIILTDLARVHARRRAAIRAQAPPARYWETADVSGGPPPLPPLLQRQLRALEQEMEELTRSLLGVGFRSELVKYWGEDESTAVQLSFLPAEKQHAVQALRDKYAALEEDIYNRARGLLLDEDSAQLRQLARAREAELAQMLTPEEFEAYQLRNSDTAHNLRSQMAGFQPTETEFREIFRLQKAFDDRFSPLPETADAAAQDQRARAEFQAQEALDREIARVLGPERFLEYQRAQEPDYRGLVQLAERFNLSRDVANHVFEMKTAAERQKAQIESNASLSEDQRGQMIAAIARATERNVASAMGEDVFRAYQRAGGQWLGELLTVNELNLALPPEPPPPPQPVLPPELRNFLLNPPVIGNPPPLPR